MSRRNRHSRGNRRNTGSSWKREVWQGNVDTLLHNDALRMQLEFGVRSMERLLIQEGCMHGDVPKAQDPRNLYTRFILHALKERALLSSLECDGIHWFGKDAPTKMKAPWPNRDDDIVLDCSNPEFLQILHIGSNVKETYDEIAFVASHLVRRARRESPAMTVAEIRRRFKYMM